jgi:acetyl-CoA C-acetyltransferase
MVYINYAFRTFTGSFLCSLKEYKAWELLSYLLNKFPHEPSSLIVGNVLQAGQGQNPTRLACLKRGWNCNSYSVNKVCGSGMLAIIIATQEVSSSKEKNINIIAGGMESMSNAPFIINRTNPKFGNANMFDHILKDGLESCGISMGEIAEKITKDLGYTREDTDNYLIASIKKSEENVQDFKEECVTIGDLDIDEPLKKISIEKIKSLKSSFSKDGILTAATSSPISDGASVVLVSSNEDGAMAKIIGYEIFSGDPMKFLLAPVDAISKLISRINWAIDSVDCFEINEAFITAVIYAQNRLNIPFYKINPRGGACILGHPIGSSGSRIVVSLLHYMKQKSLKRGIASICIGGGEAIAIAFESC